MRRRSTERGKLLTHALLTAVTGSITEGGVGPAPIWLLFVAIGSGVGLIVGLAVAIGWIRSSELPGYRVFDCLGLYWGLRPESV